MHQLDTIRKLQTHFHISTKNPPGARLLLSDFAAVNGYLKLVPNIPSYLDVAKTGLYTPAFQDTTLLMAEKLPSDGFLCSFSSSSFRFTTFSLSGLEISKTMSNIPFRYVTLVFMCVI